MKISDIEGTSYIDACPFRFELQLASNTSRRECAALMRGLACDQRRSGLVDILAVLEENAAMSNYQSR